LSGEDESAIRAFLGTRVPELLGDDAARSSAAREAILAPLACPGSTIAFRLKYADAVAPSLAPALKGRDERVSVNALLVLGAMRTTSASDAMGPALSSASPVVRFGAASGHRTLLSELARDAFGFPEASIDRMLDRLGEALAVEAEANVADMLIVALGQAPDANAALKGRSALRLADGLTRRVRSLRGGGTVDEAWWSAVLRGLDLARKTLFAQGGSGQIDKEFARRAALLGGQVLAMARDASGAPGTPPADLLKAVGAAEGLAVFAHNAVASEKVAERGVQKLIEGGRAAEFGAGVEPILKALEKPPFGAKASDFAPGK
jgi:hypothetical protein